MSLLFGSRSAADELFAPKISSESAYNLNHSFLPLQGRCILVDWLAFAVALLAIWIALRESKRNSSVWITIEDCVSDASLSVSENNCQLFHRFSVKIRNHGIPLYGLSVAICFRGVDGSGTLSFPIRRMDLAGDRDEFSRGMISMFQLKSYEMSTQEKNFLGLLESIRKQDATLNFYSQNYLCASFAIHSRTTWLKSTWNRLAWRFNHMLTRRVGRNKEGHDIIRTPQVMPVFKIRLDKLTEFIKSIKQEAEQCDGPKATITPFSQKNTIPAAGGSPNLLR